MHYVRFCLTPDQVRSFESVLFSSPVTTPSTRSRSSYPQRPVRSFSATFVIDHVYSSCNPLDDVVQKLCRRSKALSPVWSMGLVLMSDCPSEQRFSQVKREILHFVG